MKRLARRGGYGVSVVAGVFLLAMFNNNLKPSYQDMFVQAGIAIILAVSLNIVNGFTGQFSIGHAGFMAAGAYAGGSITQPLFEAFKKAATPGTSSAQVLSNFAHQYWWVLPVAMLVGGGVAALFGLAVGVPSLRLRGDYLAIVTLGFGEIIRVLLNNATTISDNFKYLGGSLGFFGIPKITTFFAVYLTAAIVIALCRNLKISLHGLAYQSIREDEIAADAMGVNTTRVKVAAFMLGAFFAGTAGALYSHGYLVAPLTFNFIFSMNLVVMVVLGGTGSITGSAIAAVVLTAIPELLKNVKDQLPWFKDEYRLIVYALILIIMMIVRPQGVFGQAELSFKSLLRRFRKSGAGEKPAPVAEVLETPIAALAQPNVEYVLATKGCKRVFGGLTAVSDLNVSLKPGELVGLIGPNGAGKTTVFNLLTGVYEPSAGSILFCDKQIAGERPYTPGQAAALIAMDAVVAGFGGWIVGRILSTSITAPVTWPIVIVAVGLSLGFAKKRRRGKPGHRPCHFASTGIARTFQNIRLFPDLTVIENVMIAAYVRRKTNIFDAIFRTGRMEREDKEVRAWAMRLLKRFEMDGLADEPANSLPYGDQRRLEIARALATRPKLLLLDEPAAGMNPQEKQELMEDILHIRDEYGLTILLIEHDMKVVMGICERIYVLEYGEIIAEGSPEAIRKDPKVIAAYLGEEAVAC